MKFTITESIFEKFPGFVCGVIIARGINNEGKDESILTLLKSAEANISGNFLLENLSQNPFFASWRKAYSLFGSEPSKFKCSSEALVRRVLKGESLRHINKIVDVYNYISIKYKTPVGGEDLSFIEGDIMLKFSEGNEHFTPLGKTGPESITRGEVIYADGTEALCRRWNWRESEKTKLTESTKDAFLVVDALPPLTEHEVNSALDEFASLLEKACNAKVERFILSNKNRSINW